MTVRAQCYSIARTIRSTLRQMLYVMNFKKWPAVFFKRGRLATALAFTFRLLTNPRSHFRISNIRLSVGLSLLGALNSFRFIFKWLPLKLGRSLLKRYLVSSRGEILGRQSAGSVKRFTNAARNIRADILSGFVALDRLSTQLGHDRRNVLHPKLY